MSIKTIINKRKNDERLKLMMNGMTAYYEVSLLERDQKLINYDSIDSFVEHFPLADRQCPYRIEKELDQHGFYIFSDQDSPFSYILRRMYE